MLYELINPSDPYTFIAETKEVAALTVLVLGPMYGAESEDGSVKIPILMFGGAEDWYVKEFGRTIEEGINALKKEIANTLLSFVLGNFKDRTRYEAAINAITDNERRQEFIDAWQDKCSSVNNIGGYAHKTGKAILKEMAKRGYDM